MRLASEMSKTLISVLKKKKIKKKRDIPFILKSDLDNNILIWIRILIFKFWPISEIFLSFFCKFQKFSSHKQGNFSDLQFSARNYESSMLCYGVAALPWYFKLKFQYSSRLLFVFQVFQVKIF